MSDLLNLVMAVMVVIIAVVGFMYWKKKPLSDLMFWKKKSVKLEDEKIPEHRPPEKKGG